MNTENKMPRAQPIPACDPFGDVPRAGRWHDPLGLMQDMPPERPFRIVLGTVLVLCAALLVWACLGKLDIVSSADGKLVPQTLVKIVQPAEAGVVRELKIQEGDRVSKGQVLAVLDATVAGADSALASRELRRQQLQARRMEAELSGDDMKMSPDDSPEIFVAVQSQFLAHKRAYIDAREQEEALLTRYEHEHRSALQVLAKLEQTVPIYSRSADAYGRLREQGFVSTLAYEDKFREFTEKQRDLDAQRATVASLAATMTAQQKKLKQMRSAYESDLRRELAETSSKLQQLEADREKSSYRESMLTLRAPQDGEIKDLATTTLGAVVQPGTVLMTLVPKDEQLYADVSIRNEDVGFVHTGDKAKVKVGTYPFQKYGMLEGEVQHISVDAADTGNKPSTEEAARQDGNSIATYKARIRLNTQRLRDATGSSYGLSAGMRVVAEIRYGERTVMEYLLSPVQRTMHDAGRER